MNTKYVSTTCFGRSVLASGSKICWFLKLGPMTNYFLQGSTVGSRSVVDVNCI